MSWTNFQMPDRIELDEQNYTNTFGRFFVYPLEKGFGVTIGNMFRRVLLSSLHGAAITHFESMIFNTNFQQSQVFMKMLPN